ncbi:MAG: DegV family protein [Clostridia bacterium]|nr:DegV family protein [Clostridia bacterium]
MAYRITTESTCDLPFSYYEERGIAYIGLGYVIGGNEYIEEPGRGLPAKEVYNLLRQKETCTTNQANAFRFVELFEPILQAGEDVLHLSFSSGLSGTYQSAMQARDEMLERYPERNVVIIDSLCASMGQGLLLHHLADNRDNGMSLEENAAWAEANKLKICHWFTVDDLMFLHRGGRVPKSSAIVGSLLGIKPVLHVDNEGHLINVSKVRGRNASLQALAKNMKDTLIEAPQTATVFISHGDCEEDARKTAAYVEEMTGAKVKLFNLVGSVIGSHSGPGTIALFFMGSER